MAMIKCSDCGKDISEKAIACVSCGCPIAQESENNSSVETQPAKSENTKKKIGKGRGILIAIIVFFILAAMGSCNSGRVNDSEESEITTQQSAQAESTPMPTPEPTPTPDTGDLLAVFSNAAANFTEDDFNSQLSFDTLARTTDEFIGALVSYTGRVIQAVPSEDSLIYRIAVDGNLNNIIWAEAIMEGSIVDTIIENDTVVLHGMVFGQTSYETVLGATMHLPGIIVVKIERAPDKEYTFDDPFVFDGLEFTFHSDFEWVTVNSRLSDLDGADVIRVPVEITNVSNESQEFNAWSATLFGPNGTELESVRWEFRDDDWSNAGSMRPGATITTYVHLLYEGDGFYFIELSDFRDTVEVKLPISR